METSTLHYDRYPYEVGIQGGDVYLSTGGPLGRFLSSKSSGVALDIGCGPGNILPLLARRSAFAIGVDASRISVRLAQQRCEGLPARVVHGNALRLPIADGSIDYALAAGSLHHTGDARGGFRELGRVLAPVSTAYVSLYRAGSYYSALYKTLGVVARWSSQHRLADRILNHFFVLPLFALYFWAGRAVVHRKMMPTPYRHLLNYFADQLLNPVVSFHTEAQVRGWAEESHLEILDLSVSHAGALMNVIVRKRVVTC
jgi:SAM-dependent methyltransferase